MLLGSTRQGADLGGFIDHFSVGPWENASAQGEMINTAHFTEEETEGLRGQAPWPNLTVCRGHAGSEPGFV